jgi:hypothetical protein
VLKKALFALWSNAAVKKYAPDKEIKKFQKNKIGNATC